MEPMLPLGSYSDLGQISLLAFAIVAVAGLAMGVAPQNYPFLPVVAGLVLGTAPRRFGWHALGIALAFIVGIATIDALVGGLFGLLGDGLLIVLTENLVLTNACVGALLLVVGLALLRVPAIVRPLTRFWPHTNVPSHSITGPGSALLFGLPFGLTTCPACTPMLLPIVGAARLTGSPVYSAAPLFVFGVARGLPLVLVGLSANAFARLRFVSRLVPALERLGGVSLVLAAGFFLFQAARLAF